MMAKFADTIGRAETYCIVCVFYMVGYILLGSSKTIGQIAGGTIIYTSVPQSTRHRLDLPLTVWLAFILQFRLLWTRPSYLDHRR